MKNPFYTFWSTKGIVYSVTRNNSEVYSYKGLPNSDSKGRYVGFPAEYDILAGDILTPNSNENFYVSDTLVDYWNGKPSQKKAYIQTKTEHNNSRVQAATVFNIGTATGSVIGTQANVTLNYNESLQNAKEQISTYDSPDKEDLEKIISLLEMIVNDQVTPHKGLFSKFSDVMERNSWITGSISATLLSWLTTQIH